MFAGVPPLLEFSLGFVSLRREKAKKFKRKIETVNIT
jgi:hypothetical protein